MSEYNNRVGKDSGIESDLHKTREAPSTFFTFFTCLQPLTHRQKHLSKVIEAIVSH